jgi:hypothetical protein
MTTVANLAEVYNMKCMGTFNFAFNNYKKAAANWQLAGRGLF